MNHLLKKISIKYFFIGTTLISAFTFIGIGYLVYLLDDAQEAYSKKVENRQNSLLLANELRQSSDNLTKFVRTYVVTRNPAFAEYYHTVLKIRNGEVKRPRRYQSIYWDFMVASGKKPREDSDSIISLQQMMINQGFSSEELGLLQEAQKNSDGLVSTETYAMNVTKEYIEMENNLLDMDSSKLAAYQEKRAEYEKAVKLMFDEDYHKNKSRIMRPIDSFFKALDKRTHEEVVSQNQKVNVIIVLIGILLLFNLVITYFVYLTVRMKITRPIINVRNCLESISKGIYPEPLNFSSRDEIGNASNSIDTFLARLKSAITFAQSIGENKLESEYPDDEVKDVLATSLIGMRDNLRDLKVKDDQNKWITQGIAKFSDIVRKSSEDEDIGRLIMSELCQFMEINQGAIFIPEKDEEEKLKYLKMAGCYAYDRKKYLNKEIEIGHGLVSQCFQEGLPIYLLEVPEDYINIRSGLGRAVPRCLYLIPLKINDTIEGVMEVASFKPIEDYKKEFLQKLAEILASSLASFKTTKQTLQLLEESKQMSEHLRSQEEELRQNMEEMAATQDAATNNIRVYREKIKTLEAEIEQLKEDKDQDEG